MAGLEDGRLPEVSVIGSEGMVGLPLHFETGSSPTEAQVQVAGEAVVLPAAAFGAALARGGALRGLLMRYAQAFYAQVTQTAACNVSHAIDQRLAR
jgi:hypothetical protein